MEDQKKKTDYADDDIDSLGKLLKQRLPWLFVGLIGGFIATQLIARFETLLSSEVRLAFFIPIIVYIADAIGTQTETIYVRNQAKGPVHFWTYLLKEVSIGIIIGLLFGLGTGVVTYLWLSDLQIAIAVSLALFASASIAPAVALVMVLLVQKEHADPAVGAGPVKTVTQDVISLLIYFGIASLIIFRS